MGRDSNTLDLCILSSNEHSNLYIILFICYFFFHFHIIFKVLESCVLIFILLKKEKRKVFVERILTFYLRDLIKYFI